MRNSKLRSRGWAGTYNKGATVDLIATPNAGYQFDGWYYQPGSQNIWRQASTNTTYSITVTKDITYEARFSKKQYTLTLNTDPAAGGTVTGGGTFDKGDETTLKATAKTDYSFTGWYRMNSGGTETLVSSATEFSCVVTRDITYEARFEKDGSSDPGAGDPQLAPNMCHWCGKVHTGFFQGIIGFFHRILASIFGAKY